MIEAASRDETEGDGSVQLKALQKVLTQADNRPGSALDAMRQLKACIDRSLSYLTDGNTAQAQVLLEQGFTNMMAAFHYLNLDVENIVYREKRRQAQSRALAERVILVFSDHAELRVGGELRGTIPLYSPEDYQELRQIAQLFECRMEHADHLQLNLFAAVTSQTSSAASREA